MYNEFAPKHYKGKWPCTTKTLYNEKTLTGRLHKYFLIYFETFSAPTADTLFLLVTMVAKAGTRFENVSKLFDHAAHNSSNYLNGHCFVSIMLCIPVWKNDRVSYLSLPLFLYSFRWNIETSYYEQKTFWSLCSYMVRSCKGIEMLVNLINICYCAMKILPYQDEQFSEYRTKSVQEFRFELSQGIRSQIFLTNFVRNIETHIKSNVIIKALKQLIRQQVY